MRWMSEIMTHRLRGKATEEIDTSYLVTRQPYPLEGKRTWHGCGLSWFYIHQCMICFEHIQCFKRAEVKRPSNNVHRPIQWRREVKWRRIPPQSSSLELQASFLSSILSLSPILCVAVKRRFVISSKSFNLSHSFSSAGIPGCAHHWTKYNLP